MVELFVATNDAAAETVDEAFILRTLTRGSLFCFLHFMKNICHKIFKF